MRYKYSARAAVMAVFLAGAAPGLFGTEDYFTELEVDRIREAQEVGQRIPILLQIAELRLAALGLVQEADSLEEPNNRFANTIIRILNPEAGAELEAERKRLEAMSNDLSDFNRVELLRGYYQALEEAMDNIDDAYERRRGDVRGAVEALRDFTETTLPIVRSFQPENEAEEIAWTDAVRQAEQALEGAQSALEIIPKNEQQ